MESPGGDIFIHGQKTAKDKESHGLDVGCISSLIEREEDIYAMVGNNTPIALNPEVVQNFRK